MRALKFYYCGVAFDLHKPRQAFLLNEDMILACGKVNWLSEDRDLKLYTTENFTYIFYNI